MRAGRIGLDGGGGNRHGTLPASKRSAGVRDRARSGLREDWRSRLTCSRWYRRHRGRRYGSSPIFRFHDSSRGRGRRCDQGGECSYISWATAAGARALGLDGIGTLEPGKAADLVLLDLDHPRYFGKHDATIGPIISGGDVNVKYSFVSGGEIVADGKLPWLDLKKLRADAARVVAKLQTT
jgi:Amidohydrolase family